MRADLLTRPPSASNVVVLDVAAFRNRVSGEVAGHPARLGWRTCLCAWIGLSVASWIVVAAVVSHLV